MPRPKATPDEVKRRQVLAAQVKSFMVNFKFTEVQLADTLGVSRRTIQMMKAGRVSPREATARRWEMLYGKYQKNGR